MADKCTPGYEVSMHIQTLKVDRSVIFTGRAAAKKFQAKWPGAKLRAVLLCDGRITRRGKRDF